MGLTTHANPNSADSLTPGKQFRHFIRIENDEMLQHMETPLNFRRTRAEFQFSMEISKIRLGSIQNNIGNVNKLCKGFNALYLLIKTMSAGRFHTRLLSYNPHIYKHQDISTEP